jgi:hypothetical protein
MKLQPSEIAKFNSALHIYATKQMVRDPNHQAIRDSGRPVLIIHATNHGLDAARHLQKTPVIYTISYASQ